MAHPRYNLPWGQDRLVPIFLATLAVRQATQTITFRSAAEILDTFGLPRGGTQYRRLLASIKPTALIGSARARCISDMAVLLLAFGIPDRRSNLATL